MRCLSSSFFLEMYRRWTFCITELPSSRNSSSTESMSSTASFASFRFPPVRLKICFAWHLVMGLMWGRHFFNTCNSCSLSLSGMFLALSLFRSSWRLTESEYVSSSSSGVPRISKTNLMGTVWFGLSSEPLNRCMSSTARSGAEWQSSSIKTDGSWARFLTESSS